MSVPARYARDFEEQNLFGQLVEELGFVMRRVDDTEVEDALRNSLDEMERRVQERTIELEEANRKLKIYNSQLEELNKDLLNFAFIASHDLHEPLRKVRTFGQMLAARSGRFLDETSCDYLARMQTAAERMQSLLDSLLLYSRVTTNAQSTKRTDLRKSVEDALSNLEIIIRETNACVEVGDLPTVKADQAQMVQLFQNLIGNSLKYSRNGQAPHVRVYARPGDRRSTFEICVEDNGIGFDEKYLDKIFSPFQRLHGKTSDYEGEGIGLAICRKIVERHGGEITARSDPGKGSTFIVTLPAVEEAR